VNQEVPMATARRSTSRPSKAGKASKAKRPSKASEGVVAEL